MRSDYSARVLCTQPEDPAVEGDGEAPAVPDAEQQL